MKRIVKTLLFAFAIALTLPLWIAVKIAFALTKSEQCFLGAAQLLSLVPGLSGVYLRRGYYFMTLDSCSADCFIEFGTWFSHRETRIGKNVYIGGRCTFGMADIGDDVLIGSNVDLLSGKNQHHMADLDRPINQQGGTFKVVRIGANCWIGNSVVVMADVDSGCVIGAGSVVANSIAANSIAIGNPARVIKTRQTEC